MFEFNKKSTEIPSEAPIPFRQQQQQQQQQLDFDKVRAQQEQQSDRGLMDTSDWAMEP